MIRLMLTISLLNSVLPHPQLKFRSALARTPCLWIESTATLHCSSRGLVAVPSPSREDAPAALVQHLVLRNNSLTGLPYRSFAAWPNLRSVDLSENLVAWIHRYALTDSSLKFLNLSSNRMQGSDISKLALRNHFVLDLRHNLISGELNLQKLKKVKILLWPNPIRCVCINQPLLLWTARVEGLSKATLQTRCPSANFTYSAFAQDKRCLNSKKFRLFVTTTVVAIGVLVIVVVTYAWKKHQHDQFMRKPSTILLKREPGFFSLRAMSTRNSVTSRCFVLYEQIAGLGRSPRPSLKSAASRTSYHPSSLPPSPRPSVKSLGCLSSKRPSSSPRPSIKSAGPILSRQQSFSESQV